MKVKDRFVAGKKVGSDVLPGASSMWSFFHKLCEIIFFSCIRRFLLFLRFQAPSRQFLSILRPLHHLRPLAKRRTYWLS